MADPRFHRRAGPFTLGELAEIAGADIAGEADAGTRFVDVAPLETAGPEDVSFLDNRRYADAFAATRAGACLVHPDLAGRAPRGTACLVTEQPYDAYARVATAFYPPREAAAGIHPSAVVEPTAVVGEGCEIGPGVVVEARAEIGPRCRVGANAVIGEGVMVGPECHIGAHVTLTHSLVGARVILHPGVRVGQDGFGFALGPQGHRKVPQLGRVLIGDDVEIGANTTIDRGTGPDTEIGAGCKIDNLVQIAHNVVLGRGCVVVAHVGISGSTKLGDFVVLGGQVGIAGHLTIGSGVRVAAQSGVMRDVPAGATVGGSPAMPMREWLRQIAELGRLASRGGQGRPKTD